jgi:hypothetical protein
MMPGGPPLVSVRYDFLSSPAIRPQDEGKPDVGPIIPSVAGPPARRETVIAQVVEVLEQEYPRQLTGRELAQELGGNPDNKREVRAIQAAVAASPELVASDRGRPAHYRLATRDYDLISAAAA